MNCGYCNAELKTGTMLCTDNDWRINDSSGSLKMIVEIHDIEDGSEEIGHTYSREYCECGEFPPIVSLEEIQYTESEVINEAFPNDNSKTITDVINSFISQNKISEEEAKIMIKSHFRYVSNWSF